ncbi:hypothetical protein PILCRDRAFT_17441 [Piloderma croceum F 1598]|uniref:Uncharacterized protein n=1 Tax=Piloderma croceum (strain F 1598) TaxID=765440 RepID=A0A0C3EEE8_PILCF|nr:hypothetical protein PILCRDRAFT_17441 [Piloderma croceum F 1598]
MTEPNMVVSAVHISLLLTIILSLPLPSSLKNNLDNPWNKTQMRGQGAQTSPNRHEQV